MRLRSIAFVASCSYSGSTLLDILLGTLNDMEALGEIKKLTEHFLQTGGSGNCCSGEPFRDCPVWAQNRRSKCLDGGRPRTSVWRPFLCAF